MSSNGARLARSLGVLLMVAIWPACGRSPIGLGEDGGLLPDLPGADTSTTTPDAEPAKDTNTPPVIPDGPCYPSCVDLCKLVYGCGLYPKGPDACLADCPDWSAPTRSCLEALVCAYTKDCKSAMNCIGSPPMADLVAGDLKASVAAATVTYTFTVCNQGKAQAASFAVALYHDSPTPPKPGQPGDQSVKVPGLAPGACVPLSVKRSATPPGSYSSWVQADVPGAVVESNEGNNVAGPVKITVTTPPKPDLTIQQFDATVNGSDIVYTVEVCNVGTAATFLFRLEIYYSKALKPGAFMIGDDNVMFLGGLAAGACKTVTRTYKNAPVGMYTSWAQVDALNTVSESNEGNNVAGPKLVAVTPASGCISLCTFATSCGVFSVMEFAQCLTWSNTMDSAAKQCADAAVAAQSCSALKSCQLPPKPPPPPPPWACFTLCNYLVNTCNLIPSGQYLTCVGGCYSLPSTKIQCANDAMNNQQCLQMMLCIL